MSYNQDTLRQLDDELILDLYYFACTADDDDAAETLEAEMTRRGLWDRTRNGG